MKKVIHLSATRGLSLYDWLKSRHTFSFDQYYDEHRIHFGALRVLNDDRVAPGEGFGTHPHKNMEIVSIPLKGELMHGDSKGHKRIITPGDMQVMSAGTGIYHSEMNGSKKTPVEFLQIWILPKERNTPPAYQDYDIRPLMEKNKLATIIAPDGSTPARLLQDVWFSMGKIDAERVLDYHLHNPLHGAYLFLIEGEIEIDGTLLSRRDGIEISETDSFEIKVRKNAHILIIEVPM